MNTFNKISCLIVVVCVTIVCIVSYKYKKVVAENLTLQEAIKKPAVVQKPKYLIREKIVYKSTPVEVKVPGEVKFVEVDGGINQGDIDTIIASYETQIQELKERQPEEIIREVYVNEGSESFPQVPKIVDQVKQKDWTGMLELKTNDGINIGISRRVYRQLSIGGSCDQDAHLGIIGQIRW